MKVFSKRTWVVLGLIAAVAALASVGAYAYFTSTGEGSGSASVGTSSDWDVDTAPESGGPMYPGGDSSTWVDVDYTVTNPSAGNQNLANVNIKIADSNGDPWSVGTCNASDFQLSLDGGSTWAAAGAAVDDTELAGNASPGEARGPATVTLRMIDSGNQDDCKLAVVPLYLYAT
jgi:hypothetical protein